MCKTAFSGWGSHSNWEAGDVSAHYYPHLLIPTWIINAKDAMDTKGNAFPPSRPSRPSR